MKLIELTRVPFGPVHVNVDHIGALIPRASDPRTMDYKFNCTVIVQGLDWPVLETLEEVIRKVKALEPKKIKK